MSTRINSDLIGSSFEIQFSRKYNLLTFLTIVFTFSNYPSFMIATLNYDRSNILFYLPFITVTLTIFFAIWFMKTKDIEQNRKNIKDV